MKRLSALLLFLLTALPLMADDTDEKMSELLFLLTRQHVQENPVTIAKQGVAILPFMEASEAAKKKGLGETVREALSRMVSRNTKFFLIDRETLRSSIKEMELSMSGMLKDSDLVKPGQMAGVKVFLRGSITDGNGGFVVNARLVNVATGRVTATAKIELPKEQLLAKREQFAFENIAQYGLGINFQTSYGPHIKSPRSGHMFMVLDAFVNYRPWLWLNFKLGVSYYSLSYNNEETAPVTVMYPGNTDVATFAAAGYDVHPKDCTMSEIAPYIGADFNWTPLTFFTLGIGVSMGMYTPSIEQVYNNILIDNDTTTAVNIVDSGGGIIRQEMESVVTFRVELKPQFFISPRLTLGVYLAFMYTTPFKISRTTINNEYTISDQFTDNQALQEKYLNLNYKIFGAGHDVTDLKLITALYGISVNFYF